MYSLCVSIPEKVEKEEKKEKERQEKRANAILGPNNRLFKELGERLAEAEQKESSTARMKKKSRRSNQSPVHVMGGKGMKSPCANSAMNL